MASFLQKNNKYFIHIAFWCVYATFFFYQISFSRGEVQDWGRILKDFSFHMIAMMVISYLNYFVFLPRFLKHKNIGRYILEFLPLFLLLGYLVVIGKQYLLADATYAERWLHSTRFIVNVVVGTLFLVIFVGLLKFVEDWFELEARKKELENEKLTSELRFLKAQISPHFLFNTLNNLYYLALNKSPNTTEVIDKLSQMMRYMLYDSNHPKVPLKKEIEYMKNYISLEKLRLDNNVLIDFEVTGNTSGISLVPLVLITFLENAFKHGVSNSAKDSWIKASINVDKERVHYHVSNSKLSESGKTVKEKSGIGLQNVKRRLELSYPENYELEVQDKSDLYAVDLKIKLA